MRGDGPNEDGTTRLVPEYSLHAWGWTDARDRELKRAAYSLHAWGWTGVETDGAGL